MTRPNDGSTKPNSKGRAANSRKRSLSSSVSSSSTSTPSSNLFSPSSSVAFNSSRTSVETRSTQKRRQTMAPSSDESSDMSSPQPSSDVSNCGNSSSGSSSSSNGAIPQRIFVQRNVPAFLNKLYSMVNDPTTDNLIHWSKDGNSFIVEGHEQFAKSVLPRFYKHNTFASFVRQLNMYDFHKVPHLQQGVLISDAKHERWEFSNPNFQRSRPEMLVLVTRKRNRERGDEEDVSLATLVKDITAIRKHQTSISSELHTMQRDNAVLWEESLTAREKHQRHQDVIAKILQFLTAVFSNDRALGMIGAPIVPRQLIKEAASLAGMSIPDDEGPPEKSLSAAGPSISSSSAEGSSSSSSSLSTPSSTTGDAAAALATASTTTTPTTSATMTAAPSKPDVVAAATATTTTTTASSTPSAYSAAAMPQVPSHLAATSMPFAMLQSIDDDALYSSGSSSSGITDIEGGIQNCTQTMDSAARSVQAIAQDIEDLQVNVEALAGDLGINPGQLMGDFSGYYDRFADDYSRLIESASHHDRKQLFELANNRNHNNHNHNHNNNGQFLHNYNNNTIAARRASSAASCAHRVPSPVLRSSVESSFCTTTTPTVPHQPHPAIVDQQQQHPALFPVPVPVPVAMMPGQQLQQHQQQSMSAAETAAVAAAAAQFQAQQVAAAQQFPVLPEEYMALLTAQAQQTYAGMAAAAAAANNNNNNNAGATAHGAAGAVPQPPTTEMPSSKGYADSRKI